MAAKDIAPLTVALVKTASGQQQAFSEPLLDRGYTPSVSKYKMF
jgi:hypothetical protein